MSKWKRIERHLPTDIRGVERVDDRRVISGIVHVLKSGCRWCRPSEPLEPLSKSREALLHVRSAKSAPRKTGAGLKRVAKKAARATGLA